MDGLIDRVMRPASMKTAQILRRSRLQPDFITICWFACYFLAALCFARGQDEYSVLAAFCILLALFLDCLDGDLARAQNRPTVSGAFLEQTGHWICQAAIIIGIVVGYESRLNLPINPIAFLGLALITDQMFHLIFFIIKSGMKPDKSYGYLHIITRKILPFMPVNSNIFWIAGLLAVPHYGLIACTLFSSSMFFIIAGIYYTSEKRFDREKN